MAAPNSAIKTQLKTTSLNLRVSVDHSVPQLTVSCGVAAPVESDQLSVEVPSPAQPQSDLGVAELLSLFTKQDIKTNIK